ncbi:Arylsulfatase precursor [Novipirellula galeiformis]|uniref:Arylsulfatase n=1 Tax=Novipirellula galeiformis TaxID=2528004 RepID=A0A5C6CPL2_9BACT|nr:sulfatase-like hydrolase/transferase [Novipirellula galeiformis]TWU24996.1 Arylsulfatase precursor [Novipirellula galeiformis]
MMCSTTPLAPRILGLFLAFCVAAEAADALTQERPHIVLVMTDDQGWGQTGYYNHPILKTPHLDAMAEAGLRFDRFYAGAPVCSPTRASVLTGRSNDRTGVKTHGYALRLQETTIARVLKNAGYATGHFGKWHLNGLKGAGVPILASDTHHPGHFGFDQWVSVSNFFDRDPLMSRQGKFEDFAGDSSDVVVAEALEFISQQAHSQQPSFTVIWFGSPHSPWLASDQDLKPFEGLDESSKHHYGELVAMDRSIGTLRDGLQRFGIADNTLVWFCSDNGGLRKINPGTTARLRGKKGSVYEGGLRVPAIVQWPGKIKPSVTDHLACTMDIFPTLVDLLGLDDSVAPNELDGISLKPLFNAKVKQREKPIPFRFENQIALIDHRFKLMSLDRRQASFTLYDLHNDPRETTDVAAQHPEVAARMQEQLRTWNESVQASAAGKDYPSGKVDSNHPGTRAWTEVEAYKPFFPEWRQRWEYERYFAPRRN